jgi:hypothetical protein
MHLDDENHSPFDERLTPVEKRGFDTWEDAMTAGEGAEQRLTDQAEKVILEIPRGRPAGRIRFRSLSHRTQIVSALRKADGYWAMVQDGPDPDALGVEYALHLNDIEREEEIIIALRKFWKSYTDKICTIEWLSPDER